jgi:hypothetical protein
VAPVPSSRVNTRVPEWTTVAKSLHQGPERPKFRFRGPTVRVSRKQKTVRVSEENIDLSEDCVALVAKSLESLPKPRFIAENHTKHLTHISHPSKFAIAYFDCFIDPKTALHELFREFDNIILRPWYIG